MPKDEDMEKLTADLKKLNDDNKRASIKELKKSSNASDRRLAEIYERDLKNDTSTMVVTREGAGRRIDNKGKATGPELKKMDDGSYEEVKDKKKFAKGGMVMANCGASVPPAQKAKK
jgi:hypothetical protein